MENKRFVFACQSLVMNNTWIAEGLFIDPDNDTVAG